MKCQDSWQDSIQLVLLYLWTSWGIWYVVRSQLNANWINLTSSASHIRKLIMYFIVTLHNFRNIREMLKDNKLDIKMVIVIVMIVLKILLVILCTRIVTMVLAIHTHLNKTSQHPIVATTLEPSICSVILNRALWEMKAVIGRGRKGIAFVVGVETPQLDLPSIKQKGNFLFSR